MKKVQLSVIMSVYNENHNYLQESILSILNQTYKNFEFIIIDDASKNSVADVIKRFNDSRIIFLRNEKNLGLTKNLNRAIKMSRGEFIARIDADDIAYPDRFDKQLKYMEKHPEIGVLGSQAKIIGNRFGNFKVSTTHDDIKASLLFKSEIIHPAVMIKGDLLRQNLYNENYRTAQDYELWSRLIWLTKFENLNLKLIQYRIHDNQITSKSRVSQDENANKVRRKAITRFFGEESSKEDIQILLDSASGKILNEFELQKLSDYSNIFVGQNKINKMYNNNSLARILSENLDSSIFRYSRNSGTPPKKELKLLEKHVFNKYTLKTKVSKLYYLCDKIRSRKS